MPIVYSSYKRPWYLFTKHLETVWPVLTRSRLTFDFEREELRLSDGDFVELDWRINNKNKLAVLSHGLEGCSTSQYNIGMSKYLFKHGYDILAWNYRGCGSRVNDNFRFYHSGESHDLNEVIHYAIEKGYEHIDLVGFSIGGNITLKFLGENGNTIPKQIKRAVTFSVPTDLASGAHHLALPKSSFYMKRFVKSLTEKVKRKEKQYPDLISSKGVEKIKNFIEFDERYTAPIHGFKNAEAYWDYASSKNYIAQITIPTLLVLAENDPFLTEDCFPFDLAKKHEYFTLEVAKTGGHVGFSLPFSLSAWSEQRAYQFFTEGNK